MGEIIPNHIQTKTLIGPEKDILQNFWEILGKLEKDRTTFVSYNGIGFDVPFINIRSLYYNIIPTNQAFLNLRRFQKYPHFDVMQWLANWDNMAKISLELACETMKIDNPKSGDIKAKDVAQAFKDGFIKKIAEYCERDVKATLELYLKVKHYVQQ